MEGVERTVEQLRELLARPKRKDSI
jgi:hypothetical protein